MGQKDRIATEPVEVSESARRAGGVRKTDLLARLELVDPRKIQAIRLRTRAIGDSFGDSFSDSFGDSFSDAFGDSFGDSFSDVIARLPAQQVLDRIREADLQTVVGLDVQLHGE